MVGKNNQEVLNKKAGRQVNRYGFRRLSVGVASVAVAGLLFASNVALVQAEETVEEPANTVTVLEAPVEDTVVEPVTEETESSPEEDQAVDPVAGEKKDAFKFSADQRAQLKEANFTEAEINDLEAEIAASHDASFDATARIEQAIASNKLAKSVKEKDFVSEPTFYSASNTSVQNDTEIHETSEGDNLEVTPEDKPDNQNAGNENVGDKIITTFSVPETDQKGNSEENNELDDTSDQLKF
ncbi:YSIRK-type signal peptide-containing protein [Facklamia languida]